MRKTFWCLVIAGITLLGMTATVFAADILEAVTKKERKTEKEPPGKIADNLLTAIGASRSQPLSRLITALGIHGVGEVMAGDLSRAFPDLDALAQAKVADLLEIGGLGPNTAEGIVDWFSGPFNRKVLKKLKSVGMWPKGGAAATVKSQMSDAFDGLTFVITGTLPTFSRDDAKAFIESHGGKVTDSISKKTSYLVLGEAPGSKFEKAKSLGVKIIGEEELKKLVK